MLLVEAMGRKPFVDEVDTLVLRGDESFDLLLAEVVTIALMKGIAGSEIDHDA